MSDQTAPSVSVVIPTHNRPELVRRAIDAVVDQQYPGPIEVLVVHDRVEPDTSLERSVDGPAPRTVRVLVNERVGGLAGARNTGSAAATGAYLAQCDDDDAWLPGKLAPQIARLEADPGASISVTGVIVEYGDHHSPRVPPETITVADLVRDRIFPAHPSSYVSPTRVHREQIGLVDEDLPGGYGEDWDWLLRAAKVGRVAVVAEPLVRVLWGSSSFFQDKWHTIVEALGHLEAKHPEFGADPRAAAYLDARRAFAHASLGERSVARRLALSAIKGDPSQKQAWAALGVGVGALTPKLVLGAAHRAGYGV